MADIRASFAAGALFFIALDWTAPAYAHGVERVRRELTEQGFEQLEFQRTKPPFKLDACRDGQRFHLHVDCTARLRNKHLSGPAMERRYQRRQMRPQPKARRPLRHQRPHL